jgi:predicted nucleotidyltransferase
LKTKDEIIAILRNFKEEFGERYGIEKLGLFGSVARGEQKEDSDIDICVKLQDPDYFTRMEIKESLEERFNAKVDVVSLTAIMRSLFRNLYLMLTYWICFFL